MGCLEATDLPRAFLELSRLVIEIGQNEERDAEMSLAGPSKVTASLGVVTSWAGA